MKIRGSDFVLYHVSDLARAVEFYRDALGLRLEMLSEQHQWAEFDCGNITLSLQGGSAAGASESSPHLALAVEDIETAHAELEARHARGLRPLDDYGVCQAFRVQDPDGNVIVLHRRADGTFGCDGNESAENRLPGPSDA